VSLGARAAIRLLKFVAVFGFGGTERQFTNLARRLDRARFDPRFGCMMRWGHLLAEIEAQRIPVSEYRVRSLWKPPALWRQLELAADMRRARIEIVHSYNFYANVFAVPAARLAGVPVVIASIRDAGIYLTPAQRRVQRLVTRLADCVLVNAESIREWLIGDGYRPEKIRIIRNGIDLSRFETAKSRAGIRNELGLPPDAPLVVTLARVNPQKGLEYFIDAAAAVGRRFPGARFLVVGEGLFGRKGTVERDVAYQQQLERRAERLGLAGRVIFTGFRADAPELLSEASLSVLPSLSEGLSNTLLESMAAGVPSVATRVGGNPELIEEGVSGLLVPPRDAAALARAMVAILDDRDLALRLGAEAKRRAVERFSLERMVRETEDLYLGLLERKTKRAGYADLSEGKTP
jgi:glycosyltransferase involved in cell wall biosynthesis